MLELLWIELIEISPIMGCKRPLGHNASQLYKNPCCLLSTMAKANEERPFSYATFAHIKSQLDFSRVITSS